MVALVVKNPLANAEEVRDTGSIPGTGNTGDEGSIPELARSPGGGNGKPLQYSCWENIPFAEKPGRLQSTGSQKVKRLSSHTHPIALSWKEVFKCLKGEHKKGRISSFRD